MSKTIIMNLPASLKSFAGALVVVWGIVSVPVAEAQVSLSDDSLKDIELSHFSSEPIHYEFHPEKHPFDSLFASYIPSVDMETIEDRVSCMDLDIPLVVNKTVCSFIHYFTVRKRNYTQTMLERKNYYFPIFEYYLRKHDMPDALKYLAIVESGLNYKAKSRVGALGLWQFMPGTGRDFRLDQSLHLDERQNPWLATEAACKFLKALYGTFQDWELALAAYNCGPGNVMKAIRRSGKKGFWELYPYLPQETRSYVPQFHAVVYSMNFAREHNIFPDIDSVLMAIPLDTFRINKTCDLRKLEALLGMNPKSLQQHNPEVKTNIFPGGVLLVPGSHSGILAQNLDAIIDSARLVLPQPLPEKQSLAGSLLFLRRGTVIKKAAQKHGLDLQEFCRINRLSGDRIRKSGKYLVPAGDSAALVRRDARAGKPAENKKVRPDDSARLAEAIPEPGKQTMQTEAQAQLRPALPSGLHRVEKGEGLFSLSRMYGISMGEIKNLNPGIGSFLWEGQQVRVRPAEKLTAACADSSQQRTDESRQEALVKVSKAEKKKEFPSSGKQFYQVQKGDTLYSITKKFNRLTVKELIRLNNLKNKQIKPGQQLIVG